MTPGTASPTIGVQQPMEAKMARDWAAEIRQIVHEEDEAWSARMEAMAGLIKAFAGNGTPTEDVLDKVDEADQRVENARAKRQELIDDFRASQP